MGSPKIVAVISGIAAIFLSYAIFGPSDEAPSSTLKDALGDSHSIGRMSYTG